nr:MAG TPA: hypothetical protein [Caudoviricetes sp.]DAW29580.1 MAG TPA: hypothetical protein [Caudoviricetes sp.]
MLDRISFWIIFLLFSVVFNSGPCSNECTYIHNTSIITYFQKSTSFYCHPV